MKAGKYRDYCGYRFFADGRILFLKTRRFVNQSLTKKGYLISSFFIDGQWKSRGVHRMMCFAWYGEPEDPSYEADHINACRHDNRIENLEWVSKTENRKRMWKNGTRDSTGENNGRAVNSCYDAHCVCLLLEEGLRPAQIRDLTHLDYHSFIRAIRGRRTWTSISKQYTF